VAGKRPLSREEQALWHKVMSDVEPLDSDAPPENQSGATKAKNKTKKLFKQDKTRSSTSPSPLLAPKPERYPELAPGKAAGLDKRNAQRLKRGQLRPEARVDLHGMTQAEAYTELNSFIAECQMLGLRTVLVITGKGSVKDGGVLRRMVPRWLNQPPLRAMVVAIEQAVPRDGGLGAYYLLLRRRR